MGDNTVGAVGGIKIPPVDIWIAGYKYCARRPSRARRCSSSTRTTSSRPQVLERRAERDRPGCEGDLPGRRPLRRRRPEGGSKQPSGASASTSTSTTSRSGSSRAASRRSTPACTTRSQRRRPALQGRQGPRLQPEEQRRGRRQDQARRCPKRWIKLMNSTSRRSSPASSRPPTPSASDRAREGGRHARPPPFSRIDPRRRPTTLVLEMRGIRKEFPGVVANDDVSFDVRRGEVHALLGENGAGQVDADEHPLRALPARRGRDQARREAGLVRLGPRRDPRPGIGMVHQHFMLIPVMTVAENIVLGTEPVRSGVFLDEAAAERRVADMAKAFNFAVDPARARRGHRRRPAAARGDHEGALPERRHPDPRRADRRADTAGGIGSVRDPADPAARGHLDHLHQPQAERGARDRRPHHGAAAGQDDRDGAAGGRDRGVARPRDGGSRSPPASREDAGAAGRRPPLGARPPRLRRARDSEGARRLLRRSGGRDRRHRGRRRQRPDGAHRRAHGLAEDRERDRDASPAASSRTRTRGRRSTRGSGTSPRTGSAVASCSSSRSPRTSRCTTTHKAPDAKLGLALPAAAWSSGRRG